MALSLDNPHLKKLADEHRQWLGSFDAQHLANWDKLLNADDEAAMTEAYVRRILQGHGGTVEPNEDLAGDSQQPDFKCSTASETFYVEVTCISIQKVVEETGLPHHTDPTEIGRRYYSALNNAFWSACKRKARQCSDLDHPSLVAIGTHHPSASSICVAKPKVEMLLTGTTKITLDIDTRTGRPVGNPFLSTDLYSAAFLRPEQDGELGFARSSISGLLLCDLWNEPPKTLGILHPNPARQFNRTALAEIPFCEVAIDHANGTFSTHWDGGRME